MYYAIHQMFFTRGSVYMVVWNLCQPEEAQKVEFWLNTIRSRADDLAIILGTLFLSSSFYFCLYFYLI